jgi:hypothetical protein
MALPRSLSDDPIDSQTPAGEVLVGDVIARFLLRLSRHRRVMRMARRISGKAERARG